MKKERGRNWRQLTQSVADARYDRSVKRRAYLKRAKHEKWMATDEAVRFKVLPSARVFAAAMMEKLKKCARGGRHPVRIIMTAPLLNWMKVDPDADVLRRITAKDRLYLFGLRVDPERKPLRYIAFTLVTSRLVSRRHRTTPHYTRPPSVRNEDREQKRQQVKVVAEAVRFIHEQAREDLRKRRA